VGKVTGVSVESTVWLIFSRFGAGDVTVSGGELSGRCAPHLVEQVVLSRRLRQHTARGSRCHAVVAHLQDLNYHFLFKQGH
jgi:hypothetical protein